MPRNGDKKRNHALTERRLRVFAAWTKGEAQHIIAAREQVHPGQITRDLDAVLKQLHGRGIEKAEANRFELLGKLAHAESELLAAWERSKRPKERTRAKTVKGGERHAGDRQEGEKVIEGRDGNPKFMAELRALWELKGKLLGLVANKLELDPGDKPLQVTVIEAVKPDAARQQKPDGTHA